MKWFKHISDSLDDPFIFDLIKRFGGDGYLVFFGVLEIYSREFKPEDNWKLTVTHAYLRRKLNKRQDTLVINSLKHIKNSGKWEVEFKDNQVIIFIPKFRELIDEWTARKIGSKSGVTPLKLKLNKNKEEEVEEDTNRKQVKPLIKEITAYCLERKNNIDADYFYDYQEARDWKLKGGSKIKNWKAVIRTWEKNDFNKGGEKKLSCEVD